MKTEIKIPAGADEIIRTLDGWAFEGFVVGGCVRDSLLGLTPHDWDICTNATPEQVKSIFATRKVLETGIKHGTVTILMDDGQYEVTTYRIDGEYSDGRHPDDVKFTSNLFEDLSRRDFTINAMAYNPIVGLVDPFHGRDDLQRKCIRTVGKPWKRFEEDALRILRALRFSSVYDFWIEYPTAKELHAMRDNLKQVSAERIQAELVKLLLGKRSFLTLKVFPEVFATIIPELEPCIGFEQNNKYHLYNVYDHIAHAVGNYNGNDPIVKLALLLHDIAKPQCYTEDEEGHGHFYGHPAPSSEIADQVLTRLKFDNYTRKCVTELIFYHDTKLTPTTKSVRRMLNKIGEEQYRRLLNVQAADIQAHAIIVGDDRLLRLGQVKSIIDELIKEQECFTLKDLAINGHDVMNLGLLSGPKVGDALKFALSKVLDEELPNDKYYLLEAVRDYLRQ